MNKQLLEAFRRQIGRYGTVELVLARNTVRVTRGDDGAQETFSIYDCESAERWVRRYVSPRTRDEHRRRAFDEMHGRGLIIIYSPTPTSILPNKTAYLWNHPPGQSRGWHVTRPVRRNMGLPIIDISLVPR